MSAETMMVRPAFTCGRCGGPVRDEAVPGFEAYVEGLRVTLEGGVSRFTCRDTACAAAGHVVADEQHLAARLAQARLTHPLKLDGPEGRFVRRVLDLTQAALAARLEITKVHLSSWERRQVAFSPALEMRFRLAAAAALQAVHPGFTFDWPALARLKPRVAEGERPVFRFVWVLGGWRLTPSSAAESAAA